MRLLQRVKIHRNPKREVDAAHKRIPPIAIPYGAPHDRLNCPILIHPPDPLVRAVCHVDVACFIVDRYSRGGVELRVGSKGVFPPREAPGEGDHSAVGNDALPTVVSEDFTDLVVVHVGYVEGAAAVID